MERTHTPGQEQPAVKPPPADSRRFTPLWMMLLALLLVLAGFFMLLQRPVGSWAASLQPDSTRTLAPTETPFVPRTPTPLPSPTVELLTPTVEPPVLDPNEDLVFVNFFDAARGWGRGEHALWRTSDGGFRWADVTPPGVSPEQEDAAAFFLNSETAWYFTAGNQDDYAGTMFRTSDGGQTWESFDTPFAGYFPSLFFLDDGQGWALVTSRNFLRDLYYTSDGGATWMNIHRVSRGGGVSGALPEGGSLFGPVYRDTNHGWVGSSVLGTGSSSILYHTEDGGRTWLAQPLDLGGGYAAQAVSRPYFFGPDRVDGVVAVQAASFGSETQLRWVVFRTSDGGETWQRATPLDVPDADSYFTLTSPDELFVLYENMLYFSIDGGESWSEQVTDLSEQIAGLNANLDITAIDFIDRRYGWAWAYDQGDILLFRTQDGGATWQLMDVDQRQGSAGETECSLSWVPVTRSLPVVEDEGPWKGWLAYQPAGYSFSFHYPPDWLAIEGFGSCPDGPLELRALRMSPPGEAQAELTIAFKPAASRPYPVAWPEAGDLVEKGSVEFFDLELPRQVWVYEGKEKAVLYTGRQEVGVRVNDTNLSFEIRLYGKDPQNDFGPIQLSPVIQEQADWVVRSFAALQATSSVLNRMDVSVTVSTSPNGAWEAEALNAFPIAGESPTNLHYTRLSFRPPGEQAGGAAPGQIVFERWSLTPFLWDEQGSFTWSPDGNWLYFYYGSLIDSRETTGYDGLFKVNLQSGEVEQVRLFESRYMVSLGVSPDAQRVAYLSVRRENNTRIILHDLATGLEQSLPLATAAFADWSASRIVWSPDSTRLVFLLTAQENVKPPVVIRRYLVMVNPEAVATHPVMETGEPVALVGWNGNDKVHLMSGTITAYQVEVGTGAVEAIPLDPFFEPRMTLRRFLTPLANAPGEPGIYETVAELYGGDWDTLIRQNPDFNPQDRALLMRRACENNGYYCLKIRRVVEEKQIGEDRFSFLVELINRDGSLFVLDGVSQFEFIVQRGENMRWQVVTLPPQE